jgi:hypothetical protein
MIVCKPKTTALFSLGTLALICYLIAGILYWNGRDQVEHPSYYYPVLAGLLAFAFGLTLRLLFGYKTIVADNGRITVKQQLLLQERRFDLKNMLDWEEIVIKTMNGQYHQLKLVFSDGKLQVSKQEYDNYEKLKSYVRQKAAAKKR